GRGRDVGGPLADVAAVGQDALDRRYVERARQVVADPVEQPLDAFVLEGGATQHREQFQLDRGGANTGTERVDVDLFAFEEEHGNVVIDVGETLDHEVALLRGQALVLGGDVGDFDILPDLVLIEDGLHLD